MNKKKDQEQELFLYLGFMVFMDASVCLPSFGLRQVLGGTVGFCIFLCN
jgi:hypothetical protein